MNLGLNNKVVVVTGGAKGIGAAISRAFAKEGALPVKLGRNPAEAKALVDELASSPGTPADCLELELTDLDALKDTVDERIRVVAV